MIFLSIRFDEQVLLKETEVDRPLRRPKNRRDGNITMDLQEVGFGGMDWIDLAQDMDQLGSLVNAVMNLRVS